MVCRPDTRVASRGRTTVGRLDQTHLPAEAKSDWIKEQGGLAVMGERNQRKAAKLYRSIDQSSFYNNPVEPSCRSWMNVPFTLADSNSRRTMSMFLGIRQAIPSQSSREICWSNADT